MRQLITIDGLAAFGIVERVQRGRTSFGGTSTTATINATPLRRSRLLLKGTTTTGSSSALGEEGVRVEFTNETTVTMFAEISSSGTRVVSWEVVTYRKGVIRRIQRGTISISSSLTGSATINAQYLGRSELDPLGMTTTWPLTINGSGWTCELYFGSETSVNFGTSSGVINREVGYQAIEWE